MTHPDRKITRRRYLGLSLGLMSAGPDGRAREARRAGQTGRGCEAR